MTITPTEPAASQQAAGGITPASANLSTPAITFAAPAPAALPNNEHGFPDNTPVSAMTETQRQAYDTHVKAKNEAKRNELRDALGNRTLDQAKADLAELETLREQTLSDRDKAIAEAKKVARAEIAAEYAPRLVRAAFGAALSQMSDSDREELMDTINSSKFLTPTGDVDTAKVTDWIAKYASTDTGPGGKVADHGQGRRSASTLSPSEAGLAEAQRRFGTKSERPVSTLSLERLTRR